MNCPDCSTEMVEERRGTALVDRCPGCRGFWFDAAEVAAFATSRGAVTSDADFDEMTGFAAGSCPRCGTRSMRLGLFRGLSFGRCDRCRGFFLNARQIEAILERSPVHGRAKAGAVAADVAGYALFDAAVSAILEFLGSVVAP